MQRIFRAFVAFAVAASGASAFAGAARAADFYKGKTITLMTGDGGGGLYDLVARTVGEFLPRYLPGAPTIVVQGMPGASQARATIYVQNVAPRDGLTLGLVQPYVVLNKILNPSVNYDPRRMTWIARLLPLTQIGFAMSRTGVTSIDQVKQNTLDIGAAGATGPAAIVPWALDRMIGTKFHVVMGYTDDSAEFIALEQGELQGLGSANYSSLVHRPGWAAKKMFNPLFAIALQRLPQLPDIPTILELTQDAKQRAVLQVLATIPAIGITIMAPPDVPADRVALLRKAADRMNADADFRAQMKKLEMDVDPMSGADLAALVDKAASVDAETVKAVVAAGAPLQ